MSLLALVLLACSTSAPEAVKGAVEAAPPQSSTTQLAPPADSPPVVPVLSSASVTFVELDPAGGEVLPQLQEQARLAAAAGRVPFAQIYADWCGPCRDLRASMVDPRMQEAFAGTWIVLLDATHWREPLATAGMLPGALTVPAIHVLASDGSLGTSIDGHAWGENTAENMAPPLQAFFRKHGARPPAPAAE